MRATLLLAVAVSVTANILHAQDNPISRAIAAWPPLALLLTVELISRVPVHRPLLAVTRLVATVTISGIAAWVSYWHMAGVAGRYGETGASVYLIPLSVDGLVVVASVCLVELGGRIQQLTAPMTAPVVTASVTPADTSIDSRDDATPAVTTPAAETVTDDADPVVTQPLPAASEPAADDAAPDANVVPAATAEETIPAVQPRRRNDRPAAATARSRATAAKVARVAARMPGAAPSQIAAKAGVSESTVRRHLNAANDTGNVVVPFAKAR